MGGFTVDDRAILPRDGVLRQGYFYLLDCYNEDLHLSGLGDDTMKRRVVQEALPFQRVAGSDFDSWLAVRTEPLLQLEPEILRECETVPGHFTQSWWKNLKVIPWEGAPGIILQSVSDDRVILVRKDLKDKLARTPFTGWETSPVEFVTQALDRLGPSADANCEFPMWYLKFRGKLRFRSMRFESGMNECPMCGHSPVICPTCCRSDLKCSQCGEQVLNTGGKYPRGPHARICEWYWTREPFQIVRGETWDGCDFSLLAHASKPAMEHFHIVTRRTATRSQSNVSAALAATHDRWFSYLAGDSSAGVCRVSDRLAVSHLCRCRLCDAGFYSPPKHVHPVKRRYGAASDEFSGDVQFCR